MNKHHVTLTIPYIWQFKEHPHIKVTRCRMVINSRTNNILRYTERGFYIEGKYYKRKDVRNSVEKPKKIDMPF
jgi:hypothetical protein